MLPVFDASEPRRVAKTHSASSPLVVLGRHVFGDKNNLRGPADELEFFRLGLRSHQVKHRVAIRRRHPHPATAGLQDDIGNHPEPELVHVEIHALLHVANKNVNRLKAEVKILSFGGKRGRIAPK